MVLGESGTGKTTSLRNLDGDNVFLIQAVAKPLPFKAKNWKPWVCDSADTIITAMRSPKNTKDIIVIDDFQYIMANEFMRRSMEHGFQKFTDIAKHAWEILNTASALAAHKRVYILAHTDTDETGKVRAKTIGKLLNEKITVEGLLTIVLRTAVINGQYVFSTKNNGSDTVKTPMGMFADEHIDNDLAAVDAAIVDYYQLTKPTEAKAA
jgi:hypothetical protein